MEVGSEYARIDAIRSVSGMKSALAALDHDFRKKVILYALERSKFQFSWSHFAKSFRIPENEWPVHPEDEKRA